MDRPKLRILPTPCAVCFKPAHYHDTFKRGDRAVILNLCFRCDRVARAINDSIGGRSGGGAVTVQRDTPQIGER